MKAAIDNNGRVADIVQPRSCGQRSSIVADHLIADPFGLPGHRLNVTPSTRQRIGQQLTRQLTRLLDGGHRPSVEGWGTPSQPCVCV